MREIEGASLIVGWQEDSGKLSSKVIEHLTRHFQAEVIAEIDPVDFFPLGGVEIDKNVAVFPISRFYSGVRKDLLIFVSNQPLQQRYRFLNKLLDTAETTGKIKEFYTIGGLVSALGHSGPRKLMGVFNQEEFQKEVRQQPGLENMTWEGPPAISSLLLWLGQKRNIPGLSLWSEVAFYLAGSEDLRAVKSVLRFFDQRFGLGLEFSELDAQIARQDEMIAALRKDNSEIDRYVRTLEVGLSLTQEEQLKLVQAVEDSLKVKSL